MTVDVAARLAIVDAIAVADVESFLGAVPPDCLLDKAGKHRGVGGIEGARIDAVRNGGNDLGTAARSIARRPIGVAGPEPAQNAGAVQKVVHQGVDGDHARPGLDPAPALVRIAEQQAGQGHGQHLVGDAVHLPQGVDDRRPQPGQAVSIGRRVGFLQPLVDPADQIAVGQVTNEQVQRIGGLVEAAVAQVMARQGTVPDVSGLGAGAVQLAVAAVVKLPVAFSSFAKSHTP